MYRWVLLWVSLGFPLLVVHAAGPYRPGLTEADLVRMAERVPDEELREPQRWVAATLTVTLGIFGAHRLYLGTSPHVPVVYGLTFGGFGVLALIDLGHILFTKDLDRFRNDRTVLMWEGNGQAEPTPP